MISLISPAKSQDFTSPVVIDIQSNLNFKGQTKDLANTMKHYEPHELAKLMNISEKLSQETFDKYIQFNVNKYDKSNSKQAIFAFTGDVYRSIDANTLTKDKINFAQNHVRILSGLYGLLQPMDMVQPYRLEMGIKIKIKAQSLYNFWQEILTNKINKEIESHQSKIILCLASIEYSKAINKKQLNGTWVDVDFKENKDGQFKNIGIFAKRARGLMVRHILDHSINNIEGIKKFDIENYSYNENLSKPNHLIFTR